MRAASGFAGGTQTLVERAQHRVVTCRDQRRGVQGRAGQRSSVRDVPLAALRSAVVVVGRQSGQSRRLHLFRQLL